MPFPNWIGKQRYWTRERVLVAMAKATQEIKGPLPISDNEWNKIKKDRLDWPPSQRIYFYFHTFVKAWLAAGAPKGRLSLAYTKWTPEEDEFLKENAGKIKLEEISHRLHRSYGACRGRLRFFGIRARDNQGYLSAAQLSKEFDCPIHRIQHGLADSIIKARFHPKANTWLIDIKQLSPAARELLTRPKRTWTTRPTDHGDYERRHGIHRKLVDGKLVRFKRVTARRTRVLSS